MRSSQQQQQKPPPHLFKRSWYHGQVFYLWFPFHADDNDDGQDEDGDASGDSDVGDTAIYDLEAEGSQNVAKRFAKTDDAHAARYRIG